jgi:hypothetical protein
MNRQQDNSIYLNKGQEPKHCKLADSNPWGRGEVTSTSDLQARYKAQLNQLLATARRLCNARVICALLGLMERRGMN